MSAQQLTLRVLVCATAVVLASVLLTVSAGGSEPEEHAAVSLHPRSDPWPAENAATSNEYTNDTQLPVPDDGCSAGWVSSVIVVPDSFYLAGLDVGVWMTHTWRSDLAIRLRAPNGATVLLMTDAGGAADNVNALFDDSALAPPDYDDHPAPPPYYTDHVWLPVEPLAALRGVPTMGTWTLDVCDDAAGDTGNLERWTLLMETDVVILEPPAQLGFGCPDDAIAYELGVLNGTATAQTFSLTYTGNSWSVTGPAVTAVLPTGEEEIFTLFHDVNPAAVAGDSDAVTVTATGTIGDSATVTTEIPIVLGWGDVEPLPPTARPTRDHSAVYASGKLYKIGGSDGEVRPYLDIYDIATDTWSTGADMPAGRQSLDCVEIDGKIYCAGGYSTVGESALYIYDISANSWSLGTALPAARYAYTAVALDDKYYVIGGFTTTYEASMSAYDPLTTTWDTTLPDMSVARRDAQSGVMGGKIYVVSGRSAAATFLSTGEAYDPGAGAWSPVAPLPVSSWLRAADGVLADRFLVLAGGYLDSTTTASSHAWAYDATADTWHELPLMEHLLYGAAGASDGDTFWVASGRLYEAGLFADSDYVFRTYACADRTDLAITKDDGVTSVVRGGGVSYTITVTNNGPSPVSNARVRDEFPPELTEVTWTCVGTGTCTGAGTGSIDDRVDLGVGDEVIYSAAATVAADAVGDVENTAQIALGTVPDVYPADNSSTDIDTILFEADLAIEKDDGVTTVAPGTGLTYSITVTNFGPDDVLGALVADLFPATLTGVTWTCAPSGAASCAAGGSGNLVDTPDLPSGDSVVYTVVGTVDPNASGNLENTAEVILLGGEDPNLANNSATDSDAVTPVVDLAVTKSDSTCYVLPGGSTTYTIVVTNLGPSAAVGVQVVDVFPAELTGVTWTCVGSGGANCTSSGSGDIDDNIDVPVGGQAVYQATGTVASTAVGRLTNTVSANPVGGIVDTDPSNNTDSDVNALEMPVFCDGFESGNTVAWSSALK